MSHSVLLTYGWVRSTYAALRNLSSHHVKVFRSDSSKTGMCQFSFKGEAFLSYTSPIDNAHNFIGHINDFCRKQCIDIIIPSHDETEILAKYRHHLDSKITLPIADYHKLSFANDKSKTVRLARELNINIPQLIYYDNDRAETVNTSVNDTYVIKLRRSNSAKGVFYATSISEAIHTARHLQEQYGLTDARAPVIQKWVRGEGWGVSCLYWEGRRIAHFTHRRLREKTLTGGTSTLREHQPNPYLEEMAFKLLDKLQWHGLAMVEFKYDPQSKTGWFIEINPRLWGSIHLAISAGVEFPYLLYLCATDGPKVAIKYHGERKIKHPWRARWYLGDCILGVTYLMQGKPLKALKSIIPCKTHTYDDVFLDDPLVFAGEMAHYAHIFLKHKSVNPIEKGMVG